MLEATMEFEIKPTFEFGTKLFHDWDVIIEKNYMIHRKKRINKKWQKKYLEKDIIEWHGSKLLMMVAA